MQKGSRSARVDPYFRDIHDRDLDPLTLCASVPSIAVTHGDWVVLSSTIVPGAPSVAYVSWHRVLSFVQMTNSAEGVVGRSFSRGRFKSVSFQSLCLELTPPNAYNGSTDVPLIVCAL